MVKKFLGLLNKEISGLHEAAYLLGAFALGSHLLALVRDRALAYFFGAGKTLDIYYASFRIPDLIFITAASVVSLSVLIPFLADQATQSKEKVKSFINSIFTTFFIFIIFFCLVVFFLVPFILRKTFPGFDTEALRQTILLTRILLLSPVILGISNLFASIIQVNKKFLVYALSPLFYNLGIIFGIFFFYPRFGIKGLAFGVVLGSIMHLLIQIPVAKDLKLIPKFSSKINFGEVKKIIALSLPRTLTMSANHISLFFLISLASTIGVGAISVFNFAFNLQSVPLSIIGVSYSVAAFPTLAKLFYNGEKESFLKQMISATRHIIFWSLPALALFIVLRAQIVRVVFGTGKFNWSDTRLTAACLALFAFSIVAQSLILLFVRGYYAMGNTKKPLFINLISATLIVVFAVILNWFFVNFNIFRFFIETMFRVEGLKGTRVLILPLSYSLGTIINASVLILIFQSDFKKFGSFISKTLFQSFVSSVTVGFVAYKSLVFFTGLLNVQTTLGVFFQGLFSGFIGILAGVFILSLLKSEELKEIRGSLNRKIWKSGIVIPEKREL